MGGEPLISAQKAGFGLEQLLLLWHDWEYVFRKEAVNENRKYAARKFNG